MRAISFLALLLAAAGIPAQQRGPEPLAPGSSAIRGTVIDAQSNTPMANVEVRVFGMPGVSEPRTFRSSTVRTAADGTFQFVDIAEGSYSVSADRPSHLPSCCTNVNLVRDQQRTDVDFRLTPGATARGRVVDTNGRPVASATVNIGGTFGGGAATPVRPARTKEDGVFELTRIPPGEWRVEVDLTPSRDDLRPPVIYYPGVLSRAEAGGIELGAGQTLDDLTIVVPSVLATTLTVRVSSPAAANTAASILRAAPFLVRPVPLSADGVGTIKGLIEGRYFVAARAWSEGKAFAAFDVVDVAEESREVSLRLQPAGSITGKIVAQRGGLPPVAGVRVAASWIHDDVDINPLVPDQVDVAADGSFRIDSLFGLRQMQLIGLPADWGIQSVLQGRSDVTRGVTVPADSNIDVTIIVARR